MLKTNKKVLLFAALAIACSASFATEGHDQPPPQTTPGTLYGQQQQGQGQAQGQAQEQAQTQRQQATGVGLGLGVGVGGSSDAQAGVAANGLGANAGAGAGAGAGQNAGAGAGAGAGSQAGAGAGASAGAGAGASAGRNAGAGAGANAGAGAGAGAGANSGNVSVSTGSSGGSRYTAWAPVFHGAGASALPTAQMAPVYRSCGPRQHVAKFARYGYILGAGGALKEVYLGEHHEIQAAMDEYGYPVKNLRDLYTVENVYEERGSGVIAARKIGERLRGKEYVGYYAVASNSMSGSASGGLFIGGTGVQAGGASSAGLQGPLLNVTEFDCELERYIVYAEEKKEPVCAPPSRAHNPKPRTVPKKPLICK